MNTNYNYVFHNIDSENILESQRQSQCFNALWRSVITQALIDAASNSKKKIDRLNKIRAIEWLTKQNDDFIHVCSMANMNPEYVKRKAEESLKRGCKWRNDLRDSKPIQTNIAKLKNDHYSSKGRIKMFKHY